MAVEAIQITFLPTGITSEEIRQVLVCKIPEVFGVRAKYLSIRIYENGPSTSAIVSGFSYSFEKLIFLFRRLRFRSALTGRECTNVNVKPDTGEERNQDGSFLENRPPSFRRNLEMLAGSSPRKVIRDFEIELLDKVAPIFTGYKTTLYIPKLLNCDLKRSELEKPGYLCTYKPFQNNSGTMLQYGTELETLQAIVYLNKNKGATLNGQEIIIKDIKLIKSASCDYKKGLGSNGECINIEELTLKHGYVPNTEFDTEILNESYIKLAQKSTKCKRCDAHYQIIGKSPLLNSFAAKCLCSYTSSEPTDRAVSWHGEDFTRLISSKSHLPGKQEQKPEFCVQYPPMKRFYMSTEDYLEINLPLLYEEWKTTSIAFKTLNQTRGIISTIRLVDEIEDKKEYAFKINVHKTTNVWSKGNPESVRLLTIEYSNKENGTKTKFKKVKLFKIIDQPSGVQLHVKFPLTEQIPPERQSDINIIPKQNKCAYNGIKAAINKWNKKEDRDQNPLTKVLLNPLQGIEHWKLQDCLIEKKPHYCLIRNGIDDWCKNACNHEQLLAVEKAMQNNVSFIHGPPGTGKSFVLSVIVNILYHAEVGNIVVAAPSNFAADNIADAILKNHPPGRPPRVLRILADSKEEYPKSDGNWKRNEYYAYLHDEVQRSKDWLNTDLCDEFSEHARANNLVLLREDELKAYWQHKRWLEQEIMNDYDVYVLTVAALGDKRVEAWASKHKITTVCLDEAGQLKHPHTINLFGLKASRYIFAGDPEQLSPQVESKSAEYAGCGMSIMDMVYLCGTMPEHKRNLLPPWTTLLAQHRMHPQIRSLVSKITYQDKLRDADRTKTTKLYEMLASIYESRVVLLNHHYEEARVGKSQCNEGEARVIMSTISDLILKGVAESHIVIITYYEAQRQYLKTSLAEKGIGIEVTNCDGYQGREAPIIFLSMTRSNASNDIGFLSNQNRLNVGLSRAKEFLFIACNLDFFRKIKFQHWKKFCECIKNY